MARPRHIMIRKVNWWWYLAPIVPILVIAYAALMNWLPSWALLVAILAFFMWLFSLLFTAYAVFTRRNKETGQ